MQQVVLSVLLGDELTDRHAKIGADRIPARPRARQQYGAPGVIASRFVRRGVGFGRIQTTDEHHTIAEGLERLCDERELEVRTFLNRAEVARRYSMGMPDPDEAFYGPRRCLADRCL